MGSSCLKPQEGSLLSLHSFHKCQVSYVQFLEVLSRFYVIISSPHFLTNSQIPHERIESWPSTIMHQKYSQISIKWNIIRTLPNFKLIICQSLQSHSVSSEVRLINSKISNETLPMWLHLREPFVLRDTWISNEGPYKVI